MPRPAAAAEPRKRAGISGPLTATAVKSAQCPAASPPVAWSQAFTATPAQARQARRTLAALLAGCPAADDAALCLSELAANASAHSRSREPGGQFTVRANAGEGRLRVEVQDQGGPWVLPEHGADQGGRGLLIVSTLARDWGRTGDSTVGWTVWFEMNCT